MSGECLTVDALAEAKGIPVEELMDVGVLPTSTGVAISYGPGNRVRLRNALRAGDGSRWDSSGRPIVFYGTHLDQTARVVELEELFLVEGESDCWTAWHHGLVALGSPGATMTGRLELSDIVGVKRVHAMEEPDGGGRAFIGGLTVRFDELRHEHVDLHGSDDGFPSLHRVRLPTGVKDLNELHLQHRDDAAGFLEVLERCIDDAERITLPEPLVAFDASLADGGGQWPELDPAALHGLAGDVVRALEPHTEADPAALLFDVLSTFGNLVGGGPQANGGGERHAAKLNLLIVGKTSRGRKGTARALVRDLFTDVDEAWTHKSVVGGTASGEGIIRATSEASGRPLFVVESEFSRVLKVAGREGSIVSEIIRQAFDGPQLQIIRAASPLRVTDAHITIVGHITAEELRRRLDDVDILNGFLNRFLIVAVRRSKKLPSGGEIPWEVRARLVARLRTAVDAARPIGEMRRSPEAEDVWADWYLALPDDGVGLVAAATARAEALVLRLSMVYALLDGSSTIEAEHVVAAIGAEAYCEDSARWLLGDKLGDPDAEKLIEAIADSSTGLSSTEVMKLFSRHRTREQLDDTEDRANRWLHRQGFCIVRTQQPTDGRPVTLHRIEPLRTEEAAKEAKNENEAGDRSNGEAS